MELVEKGSRKGFLFVFAHYSDTYHNNFLCITLNICLKNHKIYLKHS